MVDDVFSFAVRIYYEDTDAAGIVYYANYLRFMERARTEWLRQAGFEISDLVAREQLLLAVRSVQIDYVQPARLNDYLSVSATIERLGHASIVLQQNIIREQTLLCSGQIKLACLDAVSLSAKRMPTLLYTRLKEWLD
ncbi:MAG TPA: tol-pal system-associated acyl-CoA thioesterase [Gammaproteobacteria bacterium]|nr:tol-pal system-associated acyl-CoA thioesterase [Gammaproteobacteria bacterium]